MASDPTGLAEEPDEPADPEILVDLLYEAEAVLAGERARPICAAMAHIAGPGDLLHPSPYYASIVNTDFDVIPEAEIMTRGAHPEEIRILSLPNWPGLDDSLARYVLAAGGPQLLLVRWYEQPIEGHDGLLIGICPGIFDPEPYIDVITCSDAYDLADRWPTRLRVITKTPG